MILPDVNILLPAFRPEMPLHAESRAWLMAQLDAARAIALADVVATAIVRIATSRRVFTEPSPASAAVEFVDALREHPHVWPVAAGPRHWPLMREAIENSHATADLVSDAHLAALALEHGCRLATRDRDFARFEGLDWFDPF